MIIVDTALQAREAEGRPIRVALLGAGFMSQGLGEPHRAHHTRNAPGRRFQPAACSVHLISASMPASKTSSLQRRNKKLISRSGREKS